MKWQGKFMWENLKWTGNDLRYVDVIADITCIAVTDGFYMAGLYPRIHAAALIIE
jgi:hypothetical protein